jgi:hypothetical protein
MQTIKTVGDLKRVLSVYDDALPIEFANGVQALSLGTDMQIARVQCEGQPSALRVELHPAVAVKPSASWLAHAYPLQQITIQLQGRRESRREDIAGQLDEVANRLVQGDLRGEVSDDDFGYRFRVVEQSGGPSFFDEPASAN